MRPFPTRLERWVVSVAEVASPGRTDRGVWQWLSQKIGNVARSPSRDSRCFGIVLFDHLVGEGEDRGRDLQPDCSRGLEIDDELELCGLLNGEVSRLGALQNLIHVCGGTPIVVRQIYPVCHKTSGIHKIPKRIHDRQLISRSQFDQLSSVRSKKYVVQLKDGTGGAHL